MATAAITLLMLSEEQDGRTLPFDPDPNDVFWALFMTGVAIVVAFLVFH